MFSEEEKTHPKEKLNVKHENPRTLEPNTVNYRINFLEIYKFRKYGILWVRNVGGMVENLSCFWGEGETEKLACGLFHIVLVIFAYSHYGPLCVPICE